MEHILNSETGAIDHNRYSDYLGSIRSSLPEHVYAFASNPDHFDPSGGSHSCLHDAWLETLTIREAASGERKQIRDLEIHLCLLGPYHDRKIYLNYTGVTQYAFLLPSEHLGHTTHGDLLAHEIRLGGDGLLLHEISFASGSTLRIECRDIKHSEETNA
jgi:hypothetical protein